MKVVAVILVLVGFENLFIAMHDELKEEVRSTVVLRLPDIA